MSTGRWGDEASDHITSPTGPMEAESGPPRRKKLAVRNYGVTFCGIHWYSSHFVMTSFTTAQTTWFIIIITVASSFQ